MLKATFSVSTRKSTAGSNPAGLSQRRTTISSFPLAASDEPVDEPADGAAPVFVPALHAMRITALSRIAPRQPLFAASRGQFLDVASIRSLALLELPCRCSSRGS